MRRQAGRRVPTSDDACARSRPRRRAGGPVIRIVAPGDVRSDLLADVLLDAVAGGDAERLYLSCGCVKAGEIPGYALLPDGRSAATRVFFNVLA